MDVPQPERTCRHPRGHDVRLETVGVHDVGVDGAERVAELPLVDTKVTCRSCHRRQQPQCAASPAPFTQARNRTRHWHDMHTRIERLGSVHQRPFHERHEPNVPARTQPVDLSNELQQHGFGSTELARHADQRNPHQTSGLRAQSTTLSDSNLGRRRESARG